MARLTKKALPRDMRAWCNEVCSTYRFVMELPMYREGMGDDWTDKQQSYYEKRLVDLLEHPPIIPSKYIWKKIKGAFSWD